MNERRKWVNKTRRWDEFFFLLINECSPVKAAEWIEWFVKDAPKKGEKIFFEEIWNSNTRRDNFFLPETRHDCCSAAAYRLEISLALTHAEGKNFFLFVFLGIMIRSYCGTFFPGGINMWLVLCLFIALLHWIIQSCRSGFSSSVIADVNGASWAVKSGGVFNKLQDDEHNLWTHVYTFTVSQVS